MTDKEGKFYEQIEYFPYGETWIQNKATSEQQSTPYKFTSKEQDPETGLYYYGARYYDAKLSRWCSADPPLSRGDYLPSPPVNDRAKERNANLPGMGGVFNSINQDAYHYAGDNPVRLLDPDGRGPKNSAVVDEGGGGTPEWANTSDETRKVWELIKKENLVETEKAISDSWEWSQTSGKNGVMPIKITDPREINFN